MKNDHSTLASWLKKTELLVARYLAQNESLETPVVKYSPPLELKEALDFSLGTPVNEESLWQAVEKVLDKGVRTTHALFLNQRFGGRKPE